MKLREKINNRTAVIGVVGLGYVGLPLAVEKAKVGYKVLGFDILADRVDLVNQGSNYIGDVVDNDLKRLVESGLLYATTDYSLIAETDAVAICVPTPLDKYRQPDTSYVEASGREIARHLHPGMLVVLESTTYPGTTEEILLPILEESCLTVGRDFFLAYSPERVDPGNKIFNTKNTPKVVGGVTAKCTEVAAALYASVLDSEVHQVSSPRVAELEKILENMFRNINIGLVNELAILCYKMGIDVWEVIEAAQSKPHGFMSFHPGPGLGGHCIPIDPFYLTWKAREYNYHTRLIEVAGEINNEMPEFVVMRVMKMLNRSKKVLNGSHIVVLGLAYKKDIDDCRESPSLKIIQLLRQHGSKVSAVDPNISHFKLNGHREESIPLTGELISEADLILLATDHTLFDYEMIALQAAAIFDTRNAFKDVECIVADYEKL